MPKTSRPPQGGPWFFRVTAFLMLSKAMAAQATPCTVTSPQDLLACALQNHPEIVQAESQAHRDSKLIGIAKQRPNPELESRLLGGKSADDTFLNTETSFLYQWELGHKRNARMRQAEIEGASAAVEVKRIREAVALETVHSLYRLRQVRAEVHLIEEILATFEKILATFRLRPELTPEQEVSRTSFQFAKEDYRLRHAALLQEKSTLLFQLELATGIPESNILNHLPALKRHWPTFASPRTQSSGSNAILEKADTERSAAGAKAKSADAKAWPDLKIGPTLNTESLDAGGTRVMGGVNFAVPLPVLNRNQGEKAYAAAETLRAQTQWELTKRQTELQTELQLRRYRAARHALAANRSLGQWAIRHHEIEQLFEKGLLSSSLVLETHRQIFEAAKSRHEMELMGIDALWRLFVLQGSYLKETIDD